MTALEEVAWLLRELLLEHKHLHWKLDKLVRYSTKRALSSSIYGPTAPTGPTSMEPTRELLKELLWPGLKKLAAWCGEKLATYGLSHILPPLLGIWLLGREGWSRLLAWVGWLLP